MQQKPFLSKGRLIGFICCCLIPLTAVALGIRLLCNGMVFNLSFAISFVLLPLAAMGLLAWCIFSGSRRLRKVILSGLILILFVFAFLAGAISGFYVQVKHFNGDQAEQLYTERENKNPLMPAISDIGQAADIEYHQVFASQYIFDWETDYLICRYTPEEYEAQKAALDAAYIFQAEPVAQDYNNCQPSVTLEGYHFRLLSVEKYKEDLWFPKKLVLIGYSDHSNEIVYLSFNDIELDYISDLEDFIVSDCGWNCIR